MLWVGLRGDHECLAPPDIRLVLPVTKSAAANADPDEDTKCSLSEVLRQDPDSNPASSRQPVAPDGAPRMTGALRFDDSDAAAKIAAGMLMDTPELIRAGIEADPDNPHFLFIGSTRPEFSVEERLLISGRLLELDSENALAAYIHAANLIEYGSYEQGMELLRSSPERFRINDYHAETMLLIEDAYIRSGYSASEAKLKSITDFQLPQLSSLFAFAGSLQELQASLPEERVQELRSLSSLMGVRIGNESRSGLLINRLMGLAIESKTLEGLDSNAPSHYAGFTVQEARNLIQNEKEEIMEITRQLPDFSDLLINQPELMNRYIDRARSVGELEAAKWLLNETQKRR